MSLRKRLVKIENNILSKENNNTIDSYEKLLEAFENEQEVKVNPEFEKLIDEINLVY